MKKVMILSAAAMMICLAMLQLSEAKNVKQENSISQEKEVKYTEITVADLPKAISESIAKDYAGYTTEKVYLGDNGTYKVIASKNEVKELLFYNEEGLLLKVEKPTPEK